jgi:hypothetical protein
MEDLQRLAASFQGAALTDEAESRRGPQRKQRDEVAASTRDASEHLE